VKHSEPPEPSDGRRSRSPANLVVQKHAASRLHYDFVWHRWRAEIVAVPKGPSMNPADKRLAVMTGHPLEYARFEA